MSTRKLAKELGLLRQRSQSSNGSKKALVSNQIFSYIIVIDFESTCWKEKNNYTQEIIEFPAVLLNTSTGEVESEFHTYVQPQEHPILSEFCTELTGITQTQVEAGIPLQICLSRFSRWLQNLQLNMGVVFPNRPQTSSAPSQKLCTFLTWSDWDLGVCLQYECKRKQLNKPDVLNSWIDLRCTYKLFYDRKPKGLNGALQDLGIQFSGREHSGLDDARNTAQLAARMMRDGCVMKITRSLVRTPLTAIPMFGNTTADNTKEKSNSNKEKNKPSLSKIPPKSCSEKVIRDKNPKENSTSVQESVQMCRSLISPKTLLNGTMVMRNSPSPQNNNRSLVLCSTTVSCLSDLPHSNQPSNTGPVEPVEEEEGTELLVEMEDRCGSYDDVVLEADGVSGGTEAEFGVDYVSDFDSECHVWEEPDIIHSARGRVTSRDNVRETVSVQNHFRTQTMTSDSSMTSVPTKKVKSHVNVSKYVNEIRLDSMNSEPSTSFAVPRAVNKDSKSNQHKTGPKGFALLAQGTSSDFHKSTQMNTQTPFRHKPFIPEKTSTPNASFAIPKAVVTQHAKHKQAPKSFNIFTDPEKPSRPSSGGSHSTSKNMLSFLSTNTLSSAVNRSSMNAGQRVTSPLCSCGRRAKRQVVSNGGPNHGRGFYCCPVRRSGSGGTIQKGCDFFKWESALMKSSPAASPAVRYSVSLCHINSTLSSRPPQRSIIRKSY